MKRSQMFTVGLALALMMPAGITGCQQSGNGTNKSDSQTASNEKNSGGSSGGSGSITLPEGSDNDDQVVTEEGAAVASDVAGAYLQLPAGIKAAGPSVSIKPAGSIKPGQLVIEVTIPLSDEMMALVWSEPENLVVLYQVEAEDGKTVYGLIPRSGLTVEDYAVSFVWKGPGNYQAAILPELVTEPKVSAPTDVPILTAAQESQLPAVSWTQPVGIATVSPRQVSLSATPSVSAATMQRCVAVLDEDKSEPFDLSLSVGASTSAVFSIAKQTAHTVYGRFQCIDGSGRLTTSGWSSAVAVSAIPPPVFSGAPASADAFVGQALVLNMTASGAASYAIVPNSMDCDTQGGWSPAVSIHSTTGAVTGTPATAGVTCTITVAAQNAGGTTQHTVAVRIWAGAGSVCDSLVAGTCTVSSVKSLADLSLFKHTGDLVIASGGHLQGQSGAEIAISVTGDIDVQNGGLISGQRVIASGQNITIQTGGVVRSNAVSTYTGATASALYTAGDSGQGAPHGGAGGGDAAVNNTAAAYGHAEQPSTMGAAGEPGTGASGGLGGGALRLNAAATLTVNGVIEANGGNGGSGTSAGGGGSGGSIWLNAGTFTGNGSLTANGGNGGDDNISENGGGGAGGRIAVYYAANSFAGTMSAGGGAAGSGTGSMAADGAGGTMQSIGASVRAHEIFVTSMTYNGNLGGLQGADSLCQARANAAALMGRWRAVLSGSGVLARDRLQIGGRVYNRAAASVATSAANLWAGTLSSGISSDEHGAAAGSDAWTGTTAVAAASAAQCSGWVSASAGVQGEIGEYDSSSSSWLGGSAQSCDQQRALYCVSQ